MEVGCKAQGRGRYGIWDGGERRGNRGCGPFIPGLCCGPAPIKTQLHNVEEAEHRHPLAGSEEVGLSALKSIEKKSCDQPAAAQEVLLQGPEVLYNTCGRDPPSAPAHSLTNIRHIRLPPCLPLLWLQPWAYMVPC